MQSTPIEYAYDLATCCLITIRWDREIQIVYKHGCTWYYAFNAKKRGILFYGEEPPNTECLCLEPIV